MPGGAGILCVQAQREIPCLWAIVDTGTNMKVPRKFLIVGTGHDLGDDEDIGAYIGTFQIRDGSFVFHVFEEDA
jgi:hypothetical protein